MPTDTSLDSLDRALPRLITADRLLNPHARRFNDVDWRPAERDSAVFVDAGAAQAWFSENRLKLRQLVDLAAAQGSDITVCRMVEALWGGLLKCRAHRLFLPAHQLAVTAASRAQNPAEALIYARTSWSLRVIGSIEQAKLVAQQGRAIAMRTGDRHSESLAASAEGRAYLAANNPQAAITALEHSLELAKQLGENRSSALRLQHLAECHTALGQLDRAEQRLNTALQILTALGDAEGTGRARCILADTLLADNQPDEALKLLLQTLEDLVRPGAEVNRGDVLIRAGHASAALGDRDGARSYYQQASIQYSRAESWDNFAEASAAIKSIHD
ncbi:tetratricopeptide repeat protein [Saccharopolyspora endophytica]|uniref:Tetratricopeptide repeat protein n=1 Tax=Saccharopolyspora endophytica TaxID=543886 RepID=A0ABS5DQL6_9PSEU|nr:tetratricopeptide repeat protein [Saccharopolyspora endophytica]MBQ0928600.1 tetratricopeptide repeat protein [Saccharopolyspora endophytica]